MHFSNSSQSPAGAGSLPYPTPTPSWIPRSPQHLSLLGVLGFSLLLSTPANAQGISGAALQQIETIASLKRNFTPSQKKLDSTLVMPVKNAAGALAGTSLSGLVADLPSDPGAYVTVDIAGRVSRELLSAITSLNGVVIYPSARWGQVRASVPLGALETLAGNPDVRNIQSEARFQNNVGAATSQGYISHRANQVVGAGVTGAGITVGVLSDSALPARVSALITSGDLPASTQVLAGQAGPSNGSDEGAAMMEIVHDIAPGSNLIFASAFNGVASFANNILALQAAGAKVIVDDVNYFNEGVFQDGPIAQAVSQVTALGSIYFSSAANSGSLTMGTSGTWEGDFLSDGPITGPIATAGETGSVHNFGTVGSPQDYDVLTQATTTITLKWSDPLGASANDYDVFILNSTGTTLLGFSAAVQSGTQDPFEIMQRSPAYPAGSRIVVVLFEGATRALHLDTHRGRLGIATTGSTYGHNAGVDTVSTAATYWNSAKTGTKPFVGAANPNEVFSSDGPRKIFFHPNGTAITPGNLLFGTAGGFTLAKPDIAAADGVSTRTPGFLPFFGTSAAAPHAAGIAALVLSVRPGYTPAQVKLAMTVTALDSMAPGPDRDSGVGVVMALQAVQYAITHP